MDEGWIAERSAEHNIQRACWLPRPSSCLCRWGHIKSALGASAAPASPRATPSTASRGVVSAPRRLPARLCRNADAQHCAITGFHSLLLGGTLLPISNWGL